MSASTFVPPPPPGAPGAAPAPNPGAAPTARRTITGLGCPSCGGALTVRSGLRVLDCPYCGSALRVVGEPGIERFSVAPKIQASQAIEAVKSWLAKGLDKHAALKREATIGEAFLCFLPFFQAEADAVGYAFGVERRTRTVGSGKNRRTETYEVPVERRLEKHLVELQPAVNPAEWGLHRVNLQGDELVPLDLPNLERLGMVFPPTSSEAEARALAFESFKAQADPAAGLVRTHFRFLELLRARFTAIYYPIWVVRYRFREQSYQVLIDAESGELAYGKAPGNDLYRAVAMVGAEAAACFVATTGPRILLSGDVDNPLAGLVAIFVGFVAILAWGFRRFRFGGVIEEGSGLRPRQTRLALERWAETLKGRMR